MSLSFAFSFSAPACTVHSPLESGSVRIVAFVPRFVSSTVSPICTVLGTSPTPAGTSIFSEFSSMADWSLARMACSSCSLSSPLFFFFRSAISCSDSRWARCRMRRASSLALRRSRSRWAARSLRSFSASSRSRWVSRWASSASLRSFSAIWRWYSALAITSSKRTWSPLSFSLALSMISSGRPSFREISKALDLPGTPMDSR